MSPVRYFMHAGRFVLFYFNRILFPQDRLFRKHPKQNLIEEDHLE